jgi:hypothetical protein
LATEIAATSLALQLWRFRALPCLCETDSKIQKPPKKKTIDQIIRKRNNSKTKPVFRLLMEEKEFWEEEQVSRHEKTAISLRVSLVLWQFESFSLLHGKPLNEKHKNQSRAKFRTQATNPFFQTL